MISFEKEVCEYLNLPKLPIKEWDGESGFEKGVAVLEKKFGDKAYAVSSFNPQNENKPRIVKVFDCEQFINIEKIFVVPEYMETDVQDADLDEESKKKAEELAKEAEEVENDGTPQIKLPDNPYFFDFIHNDDEAIAYIDAYNKKNKIQGGKLPKKHESILNRLLVIYTEMQKVSGIDKVDANTQEAPVADETADAEETPVESENENE